MYQCCGLHFSQLKNKEVVDANNEKVGTVDDFVITYSVDSIELKSLVLGGGRVEELLESIGLKPDIDPVFQFDCISNIADKLHLSVAKDTLKTTLDEGSIGENDMRLSDFSKLMVTDADGFKIGKVIDVWFDVEGSPWLLLGGGFIEETLEKIGVQPDVDLLVPMPFIHDISKDGICLKYTKFQLESNAQKEFDRYKREVSSQHEPGDAQYESMRLSGRPQRGMA